MMDIIPAEKRMGADHGWLKTHYLFSFGDYYDPKNIQFGLIRVFNDDYFGPKSGFPEHPHADMEIITIVLEGEITHEDSMGHKKKVPPGDVQVMTAGSGIEHAEYNEGDKTLHLYQIWLRPSKAGLPPNYEQKTFKPQDWHNKLLAVASGEGKKGAAKISTDATIYRCELDSGKKLEFPSKGRKVLVYLTNGSLELNGQLLKQCGQARIEGEEKLSIIAKEKTHFVLIDSA